MELSDFGEGCLQQRDSPFEIAGFVSLQPIAAIGEQTAGSRAEEEDANDA
jgi:hypothetical protein